MLYLELFKFDSLQFVHATCVVLVLPLRLSVGGAVKMYNYTRPTRWGKCSPAVTIIAIIFLAQCVSGIRRSYDDFDHTIDPSQWSHYRGVNVRSDKCGQLSGDARQPLTPRIVPVWDDGGCCLLETIPKLGRRARLSIPPKAIMNARTEFPRGPLAGSALYFDGSSLPREASTKDLQTYTGGVVRFYLVSMHSLFSYLLVPHRTLPTPLPLERYSVRDCQFLSAAPMRSFSRPLLVLK